ncbi:MAG: tyrosine-type recombinase/integrase [Chloroflexota bacterium]
MPVSINNPRLPTSKRERMIESVRWDRPEQLIDVSEFSRLIDAWLDDKSRTVVEKTLLGYREKIMYFLEYLNAFELRECSRSDIEEFARWLSRRPSQHDPYRALGWNTRNDVHRRLRALFRWAFREGYLERSYADWVPAAYGAKPARAAPSLSVIEAMMDPKLHDKVVYPERSRAVVALLFGVGLRRIEVHRLNVDDIKMPLGGQPHLRIIGKAQVERLAAFDNVVGYHLERYLEKRGYPTSGPLFMSSHGTRLSLQGVYRAYRALAKQAGVFDELNGTHDGRRMFITHWRRYQQGVNSDDLLRRQVGHSSTDMTNHYSLQDVEAIGESFISPLGTLKKARQ